MYDVSVIVPVYNTSEYLSFCIDSLLQQSCAIEIILVNDGSTDNSEEICNKYAEKHKNITVISKNNGGLSSARNAGLQVVTGEFIGFVDSDDYVSGDMYDYLLKLQKQFDADVVQIEYEIVANDKKTGIKTPKEEKIVCLSNKDEILKRYLLDGMKPIKSYSACTKIYRKRLFDGIKFPEGRIYEDVVTNYDILAKTGKYVISNKQCYFYLLRHGSITKNKFSCRDLDYIKAGEELAIRTANNTKLRCLGIMTLARFHFTCLCKILKFNCDECIDWKQQINTSIPIIRNGVLYLLSSEMSVSRKIILLLMSMNIRMTKLFFFFMKLR